MKKRNAFTSKNTNGFNADQIEAMCERYDLWAHENQFHGANFKEWQQRSEQAKGAIVRRATDVLRSLETQELSTHDPTPVENGAQAPPWPPSEGVTGKDPVDPNTLEPLPDTLPGVG